MENKSPTREDIIQALKELEAEGKQPGRKALEQKGINGYWIAKLIPEGLTQLKQKYGIKISPQERLLSDDELLKKIDEVVSHLGYVPSWTQLRRETGITDKVFLKRSGNKGIYGVFSHYRKWLEAYHPESKNIILVDMYLEDRDKSKTPAESEGQDEKQSLPTPAKHTLRARQQRDDFLSSQLKPVPSYKSHCDHCGNETFKSWISSQEVFSEQELVEYKLYRCTICEHVILQKETTRFAIAITPSIPRSPKNKILPHNKHIEQLWPPSFAFPPEVPERIRIIYEVGRNIKSKSASLFVVQIRRALEAVMKDRKAEGKALFDKINWLIQNDQLPPVFGQMSHISRKIANLGAHDAETEVQLSEAEIVDEFFRAIIEYIYIAPAKVDQIRALIEKK